MSNFYREHIDSNVQESCTLQRIQYFDTPYHVFLLGTFTNRSVESTDDVEYKNDNKEQRNNCDCSVEADKESYRLLTFTKVNYNEVCKSKLSCCCSTSLQSWKYVNVNDLLVYSLRSSELSRDEVHTFVNSFHDNCLRCDNREVEVSCGESAGILGCVRFTQGYYLALASSRTHVASIRTCNVYEVNNYILLSLMTEMSDNDINVNNVTLREQSPLTLFQQPTPSQISSTSSFFNLSWWTNWGSTNTPTDKTNNNNDNNRSTNKDNNKRRSYSSSCSSSSSSLHYTETQRMRKHRSVNNAHGLKRLSSRIASAAAPYLFNTRTSEDHYVEQFLANNMKHSFYFAHDYDLTNTLQANNSVTIGGDAKRLHKRMKYVWNTFLLEPFAIETATRKNKISSSRHKHVNKHIKINSRKKESVQSFMGENDFIFPAGLSCWLLYCIHGAITQQVIMPHHCSVQGTNHSTTTTTNINNDNNNIDIVKEIKRDTALETTNSLNSTSVSTPPECSLLHVILIARVSKDFAGTRYLRRGVSADGRVANHVEIEQIVCVAKELKRKSENSTPQSTNVEVETETDNNKNNNTKSYKQVDVKEQEHKEKESINCTSYVQVRGSIPIRWFHPQTSLPKPPIEIGFSDIVDSTTITHFQELICDYGTPVIVMNLVRQHERHERESALGKVYCAVIDKLQAAVEYDKSKYYHNHDEENQEHENMKGSENDNTVLYYRAMDLKHVADQAWNVVTAAAESDMIKTGIYADSLCRKANTKFNMYNMHITNRSKNMERGLHKQVQCGVVRTNCIDCIDRTNICQFIYGLHALGVQLHALGVLAENTDLIASHVLQETLLSMYFTLGDALATQYGGSAHVGAGVLHRGAGWDQLMCMKRLYHNVLGDKTKQVALNLFLGRVQPSPLQLSRSMNLYMALPFQVHHLEELRQIRNAINSTRSLQRHNRQQHTKKRIRNAKRKKNSSNTTVVPFALRKESIAEIENSSAELHRNITFDQADTTNVELFEINNSVNLDNIDKQSKNRETHCEKCLQNKCSESSASSSTTTSLSSSISSSSFTSSSSFENDRERAMKRESHERHNKTGEKRHNNANNDNRRAMQYMDKQQPMHLSTAQSFLARFFVGKKRPLLHHHHHQHHHCHSVDNLLSSKHTDRRSATLCNLHNSDKVKMTHHIDNCKDDVESVEKIIVTARGASSAKEQQLQEQQQEEQIEDKSKLKNLSALTEESVSIAANSCKNTTNYVNNNYTHVAGDITGCNAVDDYGSDVYVDLVNESEGDYYLHSQQTPHLPNLTLWRNWWKAPLECYNERQSNIITLENEKLRVLQVNNTLQSCDINEHSDNIATQRSEEKLELTNTENTMTIETNNDMTEDLILSYAHHRHNNNNNESKRNMTRSEYNTSHLYRSGKIEINLPMEEFAKSKQEKKTNVNIHSTPEKSKFALSEPSIDHTTVQPVIAFVATCDEQEHSRVNVNTKANIALTQTTVTIGTTQLSEICHFLQAVQRRSVENLIELSSSEPMVTELNIIFSPIFKENSANGNKTIVYNSQAHHNNDKMCEFIVQHCNFVKEVYDSLYQDNSTYYKNVSSHCLDALTYDEACRFVFIKFGQPLEWDADTVCDALIAYAPDLSRGTLHTIRNTLRWTGNDIVQDRVNMELIKNDKKVITQFVTHVQEYANQELLIYEKSYNYNSGGAIAKAIPLSSMHEAYCAQYKQTLHKIIKYFFRSDVRVDQVYHVLQTFVSRMTDAETGVRCHSFTRYTDTFASHDKHKSHIPLARVVKHAFSLKMLLIWLQNNAQRCHLRLDPECIMHEQENRVVWQLVEFLYYMSIIVPVVQLTPNDNDDNNKDENKNHDKGKAMITQIQLHDKTALFRFGYHVKKSCTNSCAADNDNYNFNLYNFIMNDAPEEFKIDNKQQTQNKACSPMHRSVSHVIYFINACQLSESWAGIALNMFTSLRKHIYANNNYNNNVVGPRAILLSERTTLVASFLHEMNALSHVLTEISLDVSTFQGILMSHYAIAFFINVYNILYIHTWMLLYCVELHTLMVALAVPIDAKSRELSSATSAISHFTSSYMFKSLWKSSNNNNEVINNAIAIEESMFYEGFGYVIDKRESAKHWYLTLSSIKNDILRCHELPPSYTCLPSVLENSTICTKRSTYFIHVNVPDCVNNEYCTHVDNVDEIVNDDYEEDRQEEEYTSINSLMERDCKTVTEHIRTHALVLSERYHCHRVTRTTQHVSPSERSAQGIDEICNAWIANMHQDRIQRRIALALLDTYIPPSQMLPNVIQSVTHSVTCDVLEHFTHEWCNTSVDAKIVSSNFSKQNVGSCAFDNNDNNIIVGNCNENDKTNFTKGMECSTSIDANCEVDLWNWSRKNDFYAKEFIDRHIFIRHLSSANSNKTNNINNNDDDIGITSEGSINNNEVNSASKQRWEHLCCPMQPTQLYRQLHEIEYNFLHTLLLSYNHTASPPPKPLLDIMSVLNTQYTNVFGKTSHDVRTLVEKDCECTDALYKAQHKLQQSFRAVNL